jgi:acyl-CoA thioesterase-1
MSNDTGVNTGDGMTETITQDIVIDDQVRQNMIYILWDSITAGYQLPIEQSYPSVLEVMLQDAWYDITVINAGESGDTSDGLIDRLDWIVADSASGDLAIIVIGGNDGLRWLSTTALQDNITTIVTAIQARGIRTIIWGMQIPTNLWPDYTSAFAQVYPDVALATDSDLIPFILTGVGGIPQLNLPDGIHPNTTWQIIVAQTVYNFLLDSQLLTK